MEPYQWDAISPVRRDRMLDAEHAVEAVTTAARESFFGWLRIGSGLVALQQAVMELSGSSTPKGKAYNAAFKVVAARVPKLAEIEAATRSHAVWMYENREAVEAWHASLDDDTKWRINHPRSVHRRYDRDQREAREAEEAEQHRRQPPQEPRQPPQDTPSDTGGGGVPEAEQPRPGVPHATLAQPDEVIRGEIEEEGEVWDADAALAAIGKFAVRFGMTAGDAMDWRQMFALFAEWYNARMATEPEDTAKTLIKDIGIYYAQEYCDHLRYWLHDEKKKLLPGIKKTVQAEIEQMTEEQRKTERATLVKMMNDLAALEAMEEAGKLTEAEEDHKYGLQRALKGWGSLSFEEEAAKKERAIALDIWVAETWPV